MSGAAVSIITPAYNSDAFLAESIRSVQAQTFADFEMLIVDDGSTDETAAIARQFEREDSRIHLLRQPNMGISCARNTALARATAPVFALLDSDDIWKPTYLEQQLRVLEASPSAGVVSANAVNLGGIFDGRPLRRVTPRVHRIDLRSLIEHEDSVCIMSIFRRSVYERVGGFDPSLKSSEDYDFWLRASVAGFDILFNGAPLGLYRRRAHSMSADDVRMLDSITTVLRKTKAALPATSAEAAIVERQLERFERTRVANAAKLALHRGEFAAAADGFSKLADGRPSARLRLAALAARHTPALLLLAHRAACAVRTARRRVATRVARV